MTDLFQCQTCGNTMYHVQSASHCPSKATRTFKKSIGYYCPHCNLLYIESDLKTIPFDTKDQHGHLTRTKTEKSF